MNNEFLEKLLNRMKQDRALCAYLLGRLDLAEDRLNQIREKLGYDKQSQIEDEMTIDYENNTVSFKSTLNMDEEDNG